MRCRHCGQTIEPKASRYVLSIMDDPTFCSRLCVSLYIARHQKKVNDYVEKYFTTEEVPR